MVETEFLDQLSKSLATDYPALWNLKPKERRGYVGLALDSVRGINQHRVHDGATALFHQETKRRFRTATRFQSINDQLRWIEVLEEFSVRGGYTKGYTLDPDVHRKIGAHLRRDQVRAKPLRDFMGKLKRTPPKAIISRDSNDQQRKSTVQLATSIVEIDVLRLLELRDSLSDPERYEDQFLVDSLIHQANLEGYGPGFLVQQYRECPHGRLMGVANGVHLQNLKNRDLPVRDTALAGQHKYDIEACHPTLMYWLCRQYGYRLYSLEVAALDRRKFRTDLAERHGLPMWEVKTAITAIIYGCTPSTSPFQALKKDGIISDLEVLEAFCEDEEVRALSRDAQVAHDHILSHATVSNGRTRNILGKWWDGNDASRVSHILQGLEARALAIAIEVEPRMSVLLHDGFITRHAVDTDQIEARFKAETGLEIRYEASCCSAAR